MQSEPFWLPAEAVIAINQIHVGETGEVHFLLFPERLDAAVLRPQNEFYYTGVDDVLSLAVNLMFSVAAAHAFEQGNKRTGFTSGIAFLEGNGYSYDGPDTFAQAELFTAVVTGHAETEDFAVFMEPYIVSLPD